MDGEEESGREGEGEENWGETLVRGGDQEGAGGINILPAAVAAAALSRQDGTI